MSMENNIAISPEEAADFEEYKRRKKILELRGRLRGLEPTLVRKNASAMEIRSVCEQAKRIQSACVCVQPVYVRTCKNLLKNTGVGVSSIIGGNSESTLKVKLYEAKNSLREGANELDFYPCISAIINGNYTYFKKEIKKILRRARLRTVKIHLDAYSLPTDKFLRIAQIALDAGGKYLCVRAEEELITLLQRQLKKKCEIKAWGVETPERFKDMLALGCARIGSELVGEIVQGMEEEVNGLCAALPAPVEEIPAS